MIMLQVGWNMILFIVTMLILITVHEFGHFWVARKCGVTVKRFCIGFGCALWSHCDTHGTEYMVAAIPIGGYVTLLDDRIDHIPAERYHELFHYKTILQRAAIIAAGPVFNCLLTLFIYWIVFWIGVSDYRPVIGAITPNSIIDRAEIIPDMVIKSIDGINTPDWNAVRSQFLKKRGSSKVSIEVESDGLPAKRKILDLQEWKVETHIDDPIITLGIIPKGKRIEPEPAVLKLKYVHKNSEAFKAGLRANDKIITVDGIPLYDWQLFLTKLRENPGRVLQIIIERKGRIMNLTLCPERRLVDTGQIVPKECTWYKIVQKFSFLPAFTKATDKTWQLIRLTVGMLVQLITGKVTLHNINGVLSIAQGAGRSAKYGLMSYFIFLAMISINLGIINLIPLPILDGGHLLFLCIETLKGSSVSEHIQHISYRIGLILILLLMCQGIFNDVSRLVLV